MIIKINFDSYLELEKIANGTFYPLKGFMRGRFLLSSKKYAIV